MILECECGNQLEFTEKTIVGFTVDAEGNREEKIYETTTFYCGKCSKEVYFGD